MEHEMKLGFDIDDTLINLRKHAFHLYNKKLGKQVSIDIFNSLPRLEIHEPFGLSDEEGNQLWNQLIEEIYFTECPAFPDAIDTLQQLDNDGHEIYYITSRPKQYGERTKAWMKERGFPVEDARFFYGMQDEEKIKIIQQLQLDYYFDDKPVVLETLLNESVHVYIKDQSYNRHLTLPRIEHWTELKEIMEEDTK